jgi:hypothetical protein
MFAEGRAVNRSKHVARQSSDWLSVTIRTPCPVCAKTGWCRVSADGRVCLCRRVSEGGRERTDMSGGHFYVHRLDGPILRTAPSPRPRRIAPPAARPEEVDAVYQRQIDLLTLSVAHHDELSRRGLNRTTICANGYRSLSCNSRQRAQVACQLRREFGVLIDSIPGLKPATILGASGLLIPVRDAAHRICSIQIRVDAAIQGKYRWLSSTISVRREKKTRTP